LLRDVDALIRTAAKVVGAIAQDASDNISGDLLPNKPLPMSRFVSVKGSMFKTHPPSRESS
jgi:hypothetical protein